MNWYTVIWATISVIGAATEIAALIDKDKNDTASEHIWAVFKVRDPRPTPLVWALRALLLTFLVWLTGHLAFDIWNLG